MDPQFATLAESAKRVLELNDRGSWTRPAPKLYEHQWLWDSCFIAIGLSTYAPKRAMEEIYSVLRGQWHNGMLPHITFTRTTKYWADPQFWQAHLSPNAPSRQTSGLTQPPVIAIAALRVAKSLGPASGRDFLIRVFPAILAYHQWIYKERDPEGTGLAVLIHPWESGLDNTPAWLEAMKGWRPPLWVKLVTDSGLGSVFGRLRFDTKLAPRGQRPSNFTTLKLAALSLYYRERAYDSIAILKNPVVAVEDLAFNSILIAANQALGEISQITGQILPDDLKARMNQSRLAIKQLRDEETGLYFNRDFITKKLIKITTVASLLPLFSGSLEALEVDQLKQTLINSESFWTRYPIPSVPINSRYFDEDRYWQGPTWINMNWLVIQGLRQHGQSDIAERLRITTLELVQKSGFREYFSALSGEGYGARDFSWTAALILDLLKQ